MTKNIGNVRLETSYRMDDMRGGYLLRFFVSDKKSKNIIKDQTVHYKSRNDIEMAIIRECSYWAYKQDMSVFI